MGTYPSGARGRATLDPRRPMAWGICDRDGFRYDRRHLRFQYQWQGATIQNQRILVCERCYDQLQEQLRTYAVPPDPIPIRDPRPDYAIEGNGPTTIITAINHPLLDGYGNPILDGYGNPILVSGGAGQMLPPDADRTIVQFSLPPNFGLFINPLGGDASNPNAAGTEFYAPGSSYQAFGAAAEPALTYYTTIAGIQIVIETQDGGVLY